MHPKKYEQRRETAPNDKKRNISQDCEKYASEVVNVHMTACHSTCIVIFCISKLPKCEN